MTPDEERQLNAYLDGALDAPATEAFEVLLLQRPDLAARVDADTLFGMAFKKYASSLPEPSLVSGAAGSRLLANTRQCWLPLSIAASLALLLGVAGGYLMTRHAGSPASVSVAYVDQLRSASSTAYVSLPDDGALVLMAPVASAVPCLATLTLEQAGEQVATTRSLSDRLGYAGLLVDAAAVAEGNATIGVACSGQTPMRYPVHLRRVAATTATTSGTLHRS